VGVTIFVVIGLLLRDTKTLGRRIGDELENQVAEVASRAQAVLRVTHVTSLLVAPQVAIVGVRVQCCVALSPPLLHSAARDIEDAIRAELPLVKQVLVEGELGEKPSWVSRS
jgi:divalent metal cation (Fe/Co/Zn/Cd) transporter